MKIIGVIPARYKSSRFPGKPLADIHGKPMIWWVYQIARQVKSFESVFVATDDLRITNVCEKIQVPYIVHIPKLYPRRRKNPALKHSPGFFRRHFGILGYALIDIQQAPNGH
ncbi:MAG: hypothetical protein LBT59_12870 [Clostridiales bacterium]|nr:hypothetical protein [Clostridiales bacterium]